MAGKKRTKKRNTKKKRKGNEISMRYRVDSVPGGRMSKRAVFNAMVGAIRDSLPLPQGMKVTWIWRNSPKKEELHDSITGAVRKSRAGFLHLMLRRLERDFKMRAPVRRASRREIEEFEEDGE